MLESQHDAAVWWIRHAPSSGLISMLRCELDENIRLTHHQVKSALNHRRAHLQKHGSDALGWADEEHQSYIAQLRHDGLSMDPRRSSEWTDAPAATLAAKDRYLNKIPRDSMTDDDLRYTLAALWHGPMTDTELKRGIQNKDHWRRLKDWERAGLVELRLTKNYGRRKYLPRALVTITAVGISVLADRYHDDFSTNAPAASTTPPTA